MNIIMCAVVLLAMPFINYAMHPDRERAVTIDPTLLVEDEDKTYEINTPLRSWSIPRSCGASCAWPFWCISSTTSSPTALRWA